MGMIDCNLEEESFILSLMQFAGLSESEIRELGDHQEKSRFLHRQKVLVEWLPICHLTDDIMLEDYLLILVTDCLIFTAHSGSLVPVSETLAACTESFHAVGKTPGFIFFLLWDDIIDTILPIISTLDDQLSEIEGSYLLGNSDRTIFRRIIGAKQKIRILKQCVAPLHRAMRHLVTTKLELISEESLKYLHGLYDNLEGLTITLEALQDHSRVTLDGYNSIVTQQTNNSVRILTIITTILMPLTLLSGIYGTNFPYIPEFGWRYAYFAFWIILLFMAGLMIFILRRKKWL